MAGESESTRRVRSIAKRGTRIPDREQLFTRDRWRTQFARLVWPKKTAANLAAEAGCSERAVKFYLAGDRAWSPDAVRVLVSKIL